MVDEKKDQPQQIDLAKAGLDAEKATETLFAAMAKQQASAEAAFAAMAKQQADFETAFSAAAKITDMFAASAEMQKQLQSIKDFGKNLDELLRLTKEGKLGPYTDDTPLPELMERMTKLKDAQKAAVETGKVDLAAANEWLISRWPAPRPCPLCFHEEWRIGPSIAQIPTSPLGLQKPPRIT